MVSLYGLECLGFRVLGLVYSHYKKYWEGIKAPLIKACLRTATARGSYSISSSRARPNKLQTVSSKE